MWGMHWGWWVFWIAFILVVVMLFRRGRTELTTSSRDTPLETLQRRYAAGEITTEEYEERRTRLERDRL
ncbi:hypothetical protein AWN76_002485 [Rhodothermaceae bacterium RA]|nr:hypothetical protein AWN76_002485 [Rhodothermaceae bacterium RA]